jgi:dTDP-glucose 4,6-dehydratase
LIPKKLGVTFILLVGVWYMESILITGGAGFIGSHFVDYLLEAHPNCHVTVLDKLSYAGKRENLCQAMQLHRNRLKFVEGDVRNLYVSRRLLAGYDAVVHFAAESHVERSTEEPLLFANNNTSGTVTLLEAARLEKVQRFLLISSVEVYGSRPEGDRPSREDDLPGAPSPYAASKAAAEIWASAYRQTYGLPVIITRSSNNYGPRQHQEKQLPAFISAALQGKPLWVQGDGGHIRQWLYVEDHCRALDLILHADAALVDGEIFNIGAGPTAERTTLQNARAVLECTESRSEIRYLPDRQPTIRRLAVDSTKLEQRLGWKPQISFNAGLERTIAYYREKNCQETAELLHASSSEEEPTSLEAAVGC